MKTLGCLVAILAFAVSASVRSQDIDPQALEAMCANGCVIVAEKDWHQMQAALTAALAAHRRQLLQIQDLEKKLASCPRPI